MGLTSIVTEIVFHPPTLMMQIVIPLAAGAQQIARVVGESVAAMIHDVLDRPTDRSENALARGQARNVEAYGKADRIDNDGLRRL